jgi:hypothetical protein
MIILRGIKMRFNLVALFLFAVFLCGCAGIKEKIPMKSGRMEVRDGEFLKYSKFVDGEKSHTFYIVSRVNASNGDVMAYLDIEKAGQENKIPANYSNYHAFIIYSARYNSIKEHYYNISNVNVGEIQARIPTVYDLKIDWDRETATSTRIFDDENREGKNSRIILNRQKLIKGFPYWDDDSLMMLGARTLDIKGGGIFYAIVPMFAKDPFPAYFNILGREDVVTKAGAFKTFKIGFIIADPFMGNLLGPLTTRLFLWKEDSPRGLIVKSQFDNSVNYLDEVSVWK